MKCFSWPSHTQRSELLGPIRAASFVEARRQLVLAGAELLQHLPLARSKGRLQLRQAGPIDAFEEAVALQRLKALRLGQPLGVVGVAK